MSRGSTNALPKDWVTYTSQQNKWRFVYGDIVAFRGFSIQGTWAKECCKQLCKEMKAKSLKHKFYKQEFHWFHL